MDDVTWLLWIDRGKTVATFLVAIGVAAEFALGWVEGPARKRLDDARETRLADAAARTAEAELELARINERIQPRHISPTQRQALLTALKAASPKGLITIDCVLGDGEGFAYANEWDSILKEAGWPTTGVNQGAYGGGGNPTGFGILVHSAATAPPHAIQLQHAISASGVPFGGAEAAGLPEGTVELLIGNKTAAMPTKTKP